MSDDWLQRAACKGLDPELFFPARGDAAGIREAKATCASCPVVDECANAARSDDTGVWGGQSERQRRKQHETRARWARRLCARCGDAELDPLRHYCDDCREANRREASIRSTRRHRGFVS